MQRHVIFASHSIAQPESTALGSLSDLDVGAVHQLFTSLHAMSGFFGFDAVLPERRAAADDPGGARYGAQDDPFGAGATEDIAVYTWGTEDYDDGLGKALMEGGDDLNDLTFGDGPISESCSCWR